MKINTKCFYKRITNKLLSLAFLPVFLFSVSGCGGLLKSSNVASCYYIDSSGIDLSYCREYEGADPNSLQEICSADNDGYKGVFSKSECSISKGAFGCSGTYSNGVKYTKWMTGTAWTNDSNSNTGMQAACSHINGTLSQY